jgi:formylglycine-generating enzyme required for sulfatase activity
VALIGAGATLCAALLGNISLIKEWVFPQNPAITVIPSSAFASEADVSILPTTTIVTELSPTLPPTLTATVTVIASLTETFTPTLTPTNTLTETVTLTDTVAPTVTLPSSINAPETGMVLVPAGQFVMGQGSDEHTPSVNAFFIDKYEVTNALHKVCVTARGCSMPSDQVTYNNPAYGDYPVVFVNWKHAMAYCEWRGARLPTEAEWEKAARGTDGRNYPWGEGTGCNLANASGCEGSTSQVGSYPDGTSVYGAYDLAGNVSEWVSSLYKSYPYSPVDGREDLNSDGLRVLRGGNWNLNFIFLRTWYRNPADPEIPLDRVGFRCAKDAP